MRLPQSVGGFRLLELIGSGSFGTVYRAELEGALGFSQDVALKLLDPARALDQPELIASLADEAALLSRIQHPNIVSVRGFERIEHDFLGTTYAMVMELVRGVSLRRLLDSALERGALLPLPASLLVLAEAAEGLQYAHEMPAEDGGALGLVHRDMKPANVLVTKEGRVKILDFGIAFAAERQVSATAAGMTKGTVLYMSPEQMRGLPLSGRSDIYSLGLVFFELVAGELFAPMPVGGPSDIAGMLRSVADTMWESRVGRLREVLRAPAPEGHELAEAEAEFVEGLLAGMLERSPEHRMDAATLATTLDAQAPAWGLRQARSLLRDLVSPQYASYERLEAVREPPPTTLEPALRPAVPLGRDEPAPVVATRMMEAGAPTRRGGSERRAGWIAAAGVAMLGVAIAVVWPDGVPGGSVVEVASLADALPPFGAPGGPSSPGMGLGPGDEAAIDGADTGAEPVAVGAPGAKDDAPVPAPELAPESEEPTPAPVVARPSPVATPRAKPSRSAPAPSSAPDARSAPVPMVASVTGTSEAPAQRAKVKLAHTPPRFVVPGSPLVLHVQVKAAGDGVPCAPRVILASQKLKKYKRHAMRSAGGADWTVSIDVPYDEEWAAGVRYFVECCWDADCEERWKGPGDPQFLDPPDF